MMETTLLANLTTEMPHAVRLQRLVSTLHEYFRCGAVALLRLEGDCLRPLAVEGLVKEALGRRFEVALHPRLSAILSRREPMLFDPASELPDPYDGLLDSRVGAPLHVHDCMGVSLYIEGHLWGALTLDALSAGTFDDTARSSLNRYKLLIESAIRVTRLEEELRGLRMISSSSNVTDHGQPADDAEILGHSAQIQELLHEVNVVASSELPVLLLGETGVGKELFARRLHHASGRSAGPLVHVNCAALPESLVESELFGHARGAFSGANTDRPGRFEAAEGGTLFLDEVGELPLSVQAKLLRVLNNGEIQRLGADQPRHVDVRIIAATNRNLKQSVKDGDFRTDLYHRLSVYPIAIPPLRERGNDVLMLAGRFLEQNRGRLGLRSIRLSAAAENALSRYTWPGNVRELEHVISRASLKAVSRGAKRTDIVTLEPELLDLGGQFPTPDATNSDESGATAETGNTILPLRDAMEDYQRDYIRDAVSAADGNWARAANMLGMDASNLHKLARRLGMK